MRHQLAVGGAGADQVLARLPRDVLDSLSPEQIAAIRRAVDERTWRSDHFADIRLTIPFPFRPVYLALVAGRERRNRTRREVLRLQHPLRTVGNVVVAAGAATALLLAAGAGALVVCAILEL